MPSAALSPNGSEITADTVIPFTWRGTTYNVPFLKILDPQVNTAYQNAPRSVPVTDFYAFLRSIYTRENIKKYANILLCTRNGLFTNGLSIVPELQNETVESLIQDVPDADLYLLAFVEFFIEINKVNIRSSSLNYDGSSLISISSGHTSRNGSPAIFRDRLTVMITNLRNGAIEIGNTAKVSVLETAFHLWTPIFRFLMNRNLFIQTRDSPHLPDFNPANLLQYITEGEGRGCTLEYTLQSGSNGYFFTITEKVPKESRKRLYRVLSYSANPMDYIDSPKTLPGEISPPLFGVELEACGDYFIREIIDAQKDLFFIGKEDSSISGSKRSRYELVTVPCSMKYLKLNWAQFFNNIDYRKFDTTTNTTNGMHVHVGKKNFFDQDHIKRFCWFFHNPSNTNFIVEVSERGSLHAMDHYTRIHKFSDSAKKVQSFKGIVRTVASFRGATNIGSKPTVEVRIFKGIVSYASVLKNLDFVDAVLKFTEDHPFQYLYVERFINWLLKETNVNQYVGLKMFLQNIDVDRYIEESRIREITFSIDNPNKIKEIITKKGIPYSGKKFSSLFTNRGRLSEYDAALANRYAH